jgi:hypothetical protein
MEPFMVTIRGQRFTPDIGLIKQLLAENPGWGRSRLSIKLCELWDWRAANGQLKDMACRTLLLRLEKAGHIVLPARRGGSSNAQRNRAPVWVPHRTEPIEAALKTLTPLQISSVVSASEPDRLFRCLLSHYHYLGLRNTVGENLKYLVRSRDGQPLACLLFGAAAWTCGARDAWIGWSCSARARQLPFVANNTRFLVLPWVAVPHLASHVLGCIARRIQADWQAKYGHGLYCLESFVDTSRYRGVCYRAANWHRVGHSRGRSRNDRQHRLRVAVKDIYLYPLARDFRRRLCDDT